MRVVALFMGFFFLIGVHTSPGQSGPSDECSPTAGMEIYSNAWASAETGDVGGFDLALRRNGSQVDGLLYIYEGADNTDGIPLSGTVAGKTATLEGTWVEHLTEYPSQKEVVQRRSVRLVATLGPGLVRGTVSIQGSARTEPIRLKRVQQIWRCRGE